MKEQHQSSLQKLEGYKRRGRRYYERHAQELKERRLMAYHKEPEKYKQRAKEYRERTNYNRVYHQKNRERLLLQAKTRIEERYRQFIQEGIMTDCIICNFPKEKIAAIEFHHTDPTTKENLISRLVKSNRMNEARQEIQKCVCLCSNCHRLYHANDIETIQKYNEFVAKTKGEKE